jgi:YVTN family beta-propeller protein
LSIVVAAAAVAGLASRDAAQDVESAATVYTANTTPSSVSILDGASLSQVVSDVAVAPGSAPQSIALSRDGSRVYTGDSTSVSISTFDTATNAKVGTTSLPFTGPLTDVVVSPDGAKVYATIKGSNVIGVLDTTTLANPTSISLPSSGSNTPDPQSIDVSSDGTSLFVLSVSEATVRKIRVSDSAPVDGVVVPSSSRRIRVSADGSTLIVVGDGPPQFFTTSALDPLLGASVDDLGTSADVAAAGANFYVLNRFRFPLQTGKGGPTAKSTVLPPSIDVYTAATGVFVDSVLLPVGANVLGIAVRADASAAYVSRDVSGTAGSVTAVDLVQGSVGGSGATGAFPRRLVVKDPAPPTAVVSYFLPRSVKSKVSGTSKDTIVASGFFDDGGADVDYSQQVTLNIGGFALPFTLVGNASGTKYKFKDATTKFSIAPNHKGSSRGKFKMKVVSAALAKFVMPNAPIALHFTAAGLADAQGTVTLTAGGYKIGKKRGTLVLPQFFPVRAAATAGGADADSFSFVGGFATNGTTPASLSTVRFQFGPVFSRTIGGTQFTKKGDVFSFKSAPGAPKFTIKIDFLRETVTVSGKKVELGALTDPTVDFLFDAGNGAGAYRNTVRVGSAGASRSY